MRALRAGQLREVLPAWRPVPSPVYLAGRQMSSRPRALADWLSERFDENQRVEAVTTVVQRRMTAASGGPGRSIYDLASRPHWSIAVLEMRARRLSFPDFRL
jgi:hypothetical protein